MDNIVQIFKALGDETRLKILIILSRKRICAKGIAKHLDISEAAVSQHLKVLREAGIIMGEKVGYHVHYDIQEPIFLEVKRFMEQMSSDFNLISCKLGIQIPKDCKAECKSNRNKCCEKNK